MGFVLWIRGTPIVLLHLSLGFAGVFSLFCFAGAALPAAALCSPLSDFG